MNILKNRRITDCQLARELADGKFEEGGVFEAENSAGIIGDVYGCPKFKDGTSVHTTAIRTIQRTKGAHMVTTYSGSVYLLPDEYASPLPICKTIRDWKIIFDVDTRDKYVRMFKAEFKKLILEKPSISANRDYSIKGIALPLDFRIAGIIDDKRVMVTNPFGNVNRYVVNGDEAHYYFANDDHYVEFELEDWNEDQAADFGVIV